MEGRNWHFTLCLLARFFSLAASAPVGRQPGSPRKRRRRILPTGRNRLAACRSEADPNEASGCPVPPRGAARVICLSQQLPVLKAANHRIFCFEANCAAWLGCARS